MRFFFAILLTTMLHASFLQAKEPTFKFTFGSTLGNFPIEINKTSEDKKNIGGIKINWWTLSPNFSSFSGVANTTTNKYRKKLNFKERKKEENFYIRINFKF